jgi:hypothetical protein
MAYISIILLKIACNSKKLLEVASSSMRLSDIDFSSIRLIRVVNSFV